MWRWRPAEIFPHQGLGVMLPDKSRREAERKRAEALLAQITGGAAAQSHGARRVTERSSVIGDRAIGALRDRAPIAQRSDGAGGTGADAHADSASATPSVLSPQRIRFNRYDRNGDESITRIEMMSCRTDAFRKLDKDGNNLLTFEEWAVATSDRFAGADGDGNGQLTRTEFRTTRPKRSVPRCKC